MASTATQTSQDKKLKASTDECRINDLSEDILRHILSMVDMKTAIKTIVLAKKWRYLWMSLPSLNFFNPMFPNHKQGFMDFVDKVLQLRDKSQIKSFHVVSYYQCASRRVNTWMTYASFLNVQELRFHLSVSNPLELPGSLFTRQTVKVLQLISCAGHPRLVIASPARLRNLEVLHLEKLHVDGQWIVQLLANCQKLETLVLKDCIIEDLSKFYISSVHLKVLELDQTWKSQSFVSNPTNGMICTNIYGSNLTSLTLVIRSDDYVKSFFCPQNLAAVVKADIDMKLSSTTELQYKRAYATYLMKLLNTLSGVKDLTLRCSLLSEISKFPDALVCTPNLLLRRLKLILCSDGACMPAMVHLLKIRHIETLVLKTKIQRGHKRRSKAENSTTMRTSSDLKLHPEGALHHLKTVEMKEFTASDDEMDFLKFLFREALVLEKIVFTVSLCFLKNVKEKLKKKELEKFQRKASSCISVSFYHPTKSLEFMNFIL